MIPLASELNGLFPYPYPADNQGPTERQVQGGRYANIGKDLTHSWNPPHRRILGWLAHFNPRLKHRSLSRGLAGGGESSFDGKMADELKHSNSLPATMRCVTVKGYGKIDDMVGFSECWPVPEPGKGEMLIKVCDITLKKFLFCRGMVPIFFDKSLQIQYIPGGDVCGVVLKLPTSSSSCSSLSKFKEGDVVVAMFHFRPQGGLADYALVKTAHSAKIVLKAPSSSRNKSNGFLSACEAAAIPSSALAAMLAAKSSVRKGDRVLVLGGGGGVGSHLLQFLKNYGASHVAVTAAASPSSAEAKRLVGLGADDVIDYRRENWWEWKPNNNQNQFDMVVDLVGSYESWRRAAKRGGVLKTGWKGGRYLTFTGDERYMQIHSLMGLYSFLGKMVSRALFTRIFWPFYPKWTHFMDTDPTNGNLDELVRLAAAGEFRPVLDRRSPYKFKLSEVKKAMKLQESYHAKGKVVIRIAN
eukprot:jgi/Bigna1/136320/aug1.33_g11028